SVLLSDPFRGQLSPLWHPRGATCSVSWQQHKLFQAAARNFVSRQPSRSINPAKTLSKELPFPSLPPLRRIATQSFVSGPLSFSMDPCPAGTCRPLNAEHWGHLSSPSPFPR
ncbi:hypothetical protein Tcan_00610, partial [Toxocara canis]